MPKEWYMKAPQYFESDKQGKAVTGSAPAGFLSLLTVSPEAYDVDINGESGRLIIQSNEEENDSKTILGIIDSIHIGDVIVHKKMNWLITTYVDDNRMNSYGVMELCKSNLAIDGQPTKQKVGTDPSGKPIYQTVAGESSIYPCVVRSTLQSNILNHELNLPAGTIIAKIRYTNNPLIKLNTICKVFNQPYKITDISMANSYEQDGVRMGIIEITATKVQE